MTQEKIVIEKKILDHGYVKYIGHLGDDMMPLRAARMSTQNATGVDEKKDDNLRDYLWRHQHVSPYEFSELLLEVKAPLFVVNEWVRHRTLSFNIYSHRYSEAIDEYYVPAVDRLQFQDKSNKQASGEVIEPQTAKEYLLKLHEEQFNQRHNYKQYIEGGLARELARINMPVSNYTKFMVKGNLRNWLHFINLRSRPEAQHEIRVYSDAILEIIQQLWPKIAEVFIENTFEAKSFSKTETEVLKAFVNEGSLELLEVLCKEFGLSGSKLREFQQKLGLI